MNARATRSFFSTSPASLKARTHSTTTGQAICSTAMPSTIRGSTTQMQRVHHHRLLLAARGAAIRQPRT